MLYLRMTRELEDTEDAEDPQRDESAAQVLVVCDAEADVVGQDGDYINDAHDRADVLAALRRRVQSQQVLTCQPQSLPSIRQTTKRCKRKGCIVLSYTYRTGSYSVIIMYRLRPRNRFVLRARHRSAPFPSLPPQKTSNKLRL